MTERLLLPSRQEQELPQGEREYLAGSFDAGVGIWIGRGDKSLRVRVTREDKGALEVFLPFFPFGPQWSKRKYWFLQAAGEDARPLLKAVHSDVRLRKPVVDLAITYLDWKRDHKHPSNKTAEEMRREEEFFVRMQQVHSRKEEYVYDIGHKPLGFRYLAGFFDQNKGSIYPDSSNGYLTININPHNKSFIQHLQQEIGGASFPKDAEDPRLWRIVGAEAEKFWGDMKGFMKKRYQLVAETVVWKHSSGNRTAKR